MHPKNITVDTPLGETSVWHSEKSRIEIEAKEKEIVKDNTAKIEVNLIRKLQIKSNKNLNIYQIEKGNSNSDRRAETSR
jgi:hypothetical protein